MKGWHLSILLLILTVGVSAIGAEYRSTESTQVIQVSRAERVNNNSNCKYMVFSDQGTFEDRDSLLFWKWNSSDLYGQIEDGETYNVTTVGWRIPFLSIYKNIIRLSKANEK